MADEQAKSLESLILNNPPKNEFELVLREQNIGESRGQRWLPQTVIETKARLVAEQQELQNKKDQPHETQ